MIHLLKGSTVGVDNPLLVWATGGAGGFLADADALEFRVLSSAGALVYPATPPGGWAAVDVVVQRLGVGRYALPWAISGAQASGIYWIEARWKLPGETAWRLVERVEAEILAVRPADHCYASVADLRDEGVDATRFPDARCLRALVQATMLIEQTTRVAFRPIWKQIEVDADANFNVRLREPVCVVGAVEAIGPDGTVVVEYVVDEVEIYNRHLRQGLLSPDDRQSPRVRFVSADDLYASLVLPMGLPEGPQSLRLSGYFGWTDPDGTLLGKTPQLVREAAVLLAAKFLPGLLSAERQEAEVAGRLTSEKTDLQSYNLGPVTGPGAAGWPTGYPDVDRLLANFKVQTLGMAAA